MKGKKLVAGILVGTMWLASLVGCGSKKEGGKDELKIAIVCDSAGQNDNGYNQSAVEGAKKAAKELGVKYKIVEPKTGVPKALESLADDGYNVIFNLEYDFESLIKGTAGSKAIAEMYPDTTFVCFNDNPNKDEKGNPLHDNVISVLFDVNQSSYVAGALSVLVNENAKELFSDKDYKFADVKDGKRAIGFIGGTNSNGITVFSDGYLQGINDMASKLDVTYDYYTKFDAGFTDSATGSTVAGTFYNEGANIVFAVAGSVGDGCAAKAKEDGRLAIHVDANKDAQQPGYILTSVIKNTEIPVFDITKAAHDKKLKDEDRVQDYTLKSGATSITDLSEIGKHIQDSGKDKWEEIKKVIKDIEKEIADGKIKVVNVQNGEKLDTAKCKNVVVK